VKYLVSALLLSTLALAGCGDDSSGDGHDHDHDGDASMSFDCTMETRAEAYVANLEKSGTLYKVSLVSDPAPPLKGDNSWTIKVTDAASGDPVDGLTVDSDPQMPDHGHGTPKQETVTPGQNPGEYMLDPINLWMPGYWEVTINLSSGAASDSVMYKICIDG